MFFYVFMGAKNDVSVCQINLHITWNIFSVHWVHALKLLSAIFQWMVVGQNGQRGVNVPRWVVMIQRAAVYVGQGHVTTLNLSMEVKCVLELVWKLQTAHVSKHWICLTTCLANNQRYTTRDEYFKLQPCSVSKTIVLYWYGYN